MRGYQEVPGRSVKRSIKDSRYWYYLSLQGGGEGIGCEGVEGISGNEGRSGVWVEMAELK